MNQYTSYDKITRYALDFSFDVFGIHDEEIKNKILTAHSNLNPFPNVKDVLKQLHNDGIKVTVLSNGSPKSVKSALDKADISQYLHRVFSTDLIKSYKPSPAVYEYIKEELGLPSKKICFVSSNAWDIAGAVSYGLHSILINRKNNTPERFPFKPDAEIHAITELPEKLAEF